MDNRIIEYNDALRIVVGMTVKEWNRILEEEKEMKRLNEYHPSTEELCEEVEREISRCFEIVELEHRGSKFVPRYRQISEIGSEIKKEVRKLKVESCSRLKENSFSTLTFDLLAVHLKVIERLFSKIGELADENIAIKKYLKDVYNDEKFGLGVKKNG